VNRHRLAEERSIELHREIAMRLRADRRIVERARERAASWLVTGDVAEPYATAWLRLLALPLEELCSALVDPGETARALRQCTPFSGMVDPRTRWRIWRDVAQREGMVR
jgi:hypothetical protein